MRIKNKKLHTKFERQYETLLFDIKDILQKHRLEATERKTHAISISIIGYCNNVSKWTVSNFWNRKIHENQISSDKTLNRYLTYIKNVRKLKKSDFEALVIKYKNELITHRASNKRLEIDKTIPAKEKRERVKLLPEIISKALKLYENNLSNLASELADKSNTTMARVEYFLKQNLIYKNAYREYNRAYQYLLALEQLVKDKEQESGVGITYAEKMKKLLESIDFLYNELEKVQREFLQELCERHSYTLCDSNSSAYIAPNNRYERAKGIFYIDGDGETLERKRDFYGLMDIKFHQPKHCREQVNMMIKDAKKLLKSPVKSKQ